MSVKRPVSPQATSWLLSAWEKNGSVCCLALIKVENLSGAVNDLLGPVIQKQD